ncbi:hypothetical protein A6M27_11435 [Acidithiobacillus thiooxidans]|uniref:Uncharacterized protein n=1 Tax=Acidithiobacillus thiooxidans TaxID=930 RepID=A0A1C2I6Z9_ACITH|nr:hypothetical protein [Acidithiobacillus thiooxidans]OCX69498.1 hypothetical protein A6O24_18350 [Acidithiobacillus thiooxidans]OCX71707.1 hypothetical protein A6P07_11545 [Acidithiobacillus thiooxidans]OCX80573.1 hypothetical protein A6O26_14535 [Acidithiobacillus thiooxidans]OCX86906.1 hypothetical protein A6M27_11435 [Acidithiobacillus thiooxidans]OFC49631.1 hypothetical protein BAE47_04725 [Acidithiobacillus thiooxidans]
MSIFEKFKARLQKEESIIKWARRTGNAKKIEKLYNPSEPTPEDKEYLDRLHEQDNSEKERDD